MSIEELYKNSIRHFTIFTSKGENYDPISFWITKSACFREELQKTETV